VTELSLRLGAAGRDRSDLLQIRRGALLHDIGKLGVPDAILLKPGPFPMRVDADAPASGVCLRDLGSINYLRPAMDIPYCHHEKWAERIPARSQGDHIRWRRVSLPSPNLGRAALRSPYRPAWPETKVRAPHHVTDRHLPGARVVEAFLE